MDTSLSSRRGAVEPEVLDAPTCRHQWMIDSPAGPSSRGVCHLCGEERHFQNYIEGSSWGYDRSLDQTAGGSRIPASGTTRKESGLDEE